MDVGDVVIGVIAKRRLIGRFGDFYIHLEHDGTFNIEHRLALSRTAFTAKSEEHRRNKERPHHS